MICRFVVWEYWLAVSEHHTSDFSHQTSAIRLQPSALIHQTSTTPRPRR